MKFKYMRIQGREDSWVTKYPKGIFAMCWRLIMDGKMEKEDEELFRKIEAWFVENLPKPEPCKNSEKVITFFKTETTKEMQKMIEPAMELLDKYNHPYDVENSLEDSCHEYIKYMESEGKMFSVHADWAKAVRWVKKCCRR